MLQVETPCQKLLWSPPCYSRTTVVLQKKPGVFELDMNEIWEKLVQQQQQQQREEAICNFVSCFSLKRNGRLPTSSFPFESSWFPLDDTSKFTNEMPGALALECDGITKAAVEA